MEVGLQRSRAGRAQSPRRQGVDDAHGGGRACWCEQARVFIRMGSEGVFCVVLGEQVCVRVIMWEIKGACIHAGQGFKFECLSHLNLLSESAFLGNRLSLKPIRQ
jgi:hypothetical protein